MTVGLGKDPEGIVRSQIEYCCETECRVNAIQGSPCLNRGSDRGRNVCNPKALPLEKLVR
jgi:hypothetical protein